MSDRGRGYQQQSVEPQVSTEGRANPHHQGQEQLGNAEMQQRINEQTAECPDFRAPAAVAPRGELSYYTDRHNDFLERYRFCGLTPPVYYLGYGDKYVRRFTTETHHRLTPDGQAWLGRARVLLQVAIEDERIADPVAFDELEKNNAAFTRFAYDTHPDAYWDAGLGQLDLFERIGNISPKPSMMEGASSANGGSQPTSTAQVAWFRPKISAKQPQLQKGKS